MLPHYDPSSTYCYYSEPPMYPAYTPPPSMYVVTSPTPSLLTSPTVRRVTNHLPNRLQYNVRQRWLLNEIYQHVPYPNSVQKNVIADRIGATREQIRKCTSLFLRAKQQQRRLGIWFQNRRRIAVQGHRAPTHRSPTLPIDDRHTIQAELESILHDLDHHRNAPQRMPVGQNVTARRQRPPTKK
jgi:hypothetical protein